MRNWVSSIRPYPPETDSGEEVLSTHNFAPLQAHDEYTSEYIHLHCDVLLERQVVRLLDPCRAWSGASGCTAHTDSLAGGPHRSSGHSLSILTV